MIRKRLKEEKWFDRAKLSRPGSVWPNNLRTVWTPNFPLRLLVHLDVALSGWCQSSWRLA